MTLLATREGKGSKRQKVDELQIQQGLISDASFTLKSIERNDQVSSSPDFTSDFEPEPPQNGNSSIIAGIERSLMHKPWILGTPPNELEQSDMDQVSMSHSVRNFMQKGGHLQCSGSNDCQKIAASCHREESSIPVFEDPPMFLPTEEEFSDTLEFIASIRPKAEEYGICLIVPPRSWEPPCVLKENNAWETLRFSTHIQHIDELQNPHSKRNKKIKGKRRTSRMGLEYGSDVVCSAEHGNTAINIDSSDFEDGPEFTPQTFQKYADEFIKQNFHEKEIATGLRADSPEPEGYWMPPWKAVENKYWQIVENPTDEVKVLSAANLEARVIGSGIPSLSNPVMPRNHAIYKESGWNFKNTAKLPGSLLSYETCEDSAISVPQLNLGMCYSSVCWKIEKHHLYYICYSHLGAAKVWYGVPARYRLKFEAALKKVFPQLSEDPQLFHKLVTQLSPSALKSEGIPVYRCVQHERQIAIIFPGAYYSGFDCGFNLSEAVNVAPFDWLPHGYSSVELYSGLGRKTSISYDKLLIGAAMEAAKASWALKLLRKGSEYDMQWKNVCGKDGILTKALKARVKQERLKRKYLCIPSQSEKMEKDFNMTVKRECHICLYDLYLSATRCECTPERYSCLDHAKQLCSCPWSSRVFLLRFEISKLDLLIDALEEKLEAVLKWGKEELGLCVKNYVANS